MEKLWKMREKTERRKSYLVTGANYHTKKIFTGTLLAIEMRKTQILINKPVYAGFNIGYN